MPTPAEPAHKAAEMLETLSETLRPDQTVGVAVDALLAQGATRATVYLADYECRTLIPVSRFPGAAGSDTAGNDAIDIEGSMGGRCLLNEEVIELANGDVVQQWLPLGARSERLGVLAVERPVAAQEAAASTRDAAVTLGHALTVAARYTDRYHQIRRARPLSLSAEIQWSLLPPRSFAVAEVAVSGQLEPAYDVGGDVYDYALDGELLHLALLDGMGHGVEASLLATAALGAYRHCRRSERPLVDIREEMDQVVGSFFRKTVFVTGVLGVLHCGTGRFTWVNAGHPPPLQIRGRNVVSALECHPAVPFGLGPGPTEEGEAMLEPGDQVLLYTDGVVDSRSVETGERFGEDRLRDFVEQEAAAGRLNSETLRRLTNSLLEASGGQLSDDATLMLIEWSGPGPSEP